jgi:DnaK suppressor protein
LTQALRHAGEDSGEVIDADAAVMGRLSRADAMQREELARETNRRRAEDLQRVQSALERVRKGDYGACLRCGQAIPSERLDADPAATLCIGCASAIEQR